MERSLPSLENASDLWLGAGRVGGGDRPGPWVIQRRPGMSDSFCISPLLSPLVRRLRNFDIRIGPPGDLRRIYGSYRAIGAVSSFQLTAEEFRKVGYHSAMTQKLRLCRYL